MIQFISFITLYGWLGGHKLLTGQLNNNMTTMKPITALMFLLTSLVLILIYSNHHKPKKIFQFFITLFSGWMTLAILVVLILMIYSSYLEINKVFDLFFITDNDPYTLYNHMPAAMTLLGFLLVAIAGGVYIFNTKKSIIRIRIMSVGLIMIGGLAIIGNIFNIPLLFYYSELGSNGMALNTSICFTLTGYFFYKISEAIKKKSH